MRASLSLAAGLFLQFACDREGAASDAARGAATAQTAAHASAPFEPKKVDFVTKAMGTEVHIIAYTTKTVDEAAVNKAIRSAVAEIERLERLMTSWRDDSEIAAVNRRPGDLVQVSDETFVVIKKSLWASQNSEGVFDITFEAMSDVWKFGDAAEDPPRLPNKDRVEELRKLIDYRRIKLDEQHHKVSVEKGQRLGLGGIAKGYIVDRAAAVLKGAGVTAFLAQAGGDLFGSGRKPDGTPWVSGIQDPRGKKGEYFALLELENHAFSTAGDYARSFVLDGKRYHHIIDPRTGYPATASRSVTVWAEDAVTADAIDDAIFILGPEKGLAIAESLAEVGVVIVDDHNKVWISKRLEGKVRILKQPTDGI